MNITNIPFRNFEDVIDLLEHPKSGLEFLINDDDTMDFNGHMRVLVNPD